MTWGTSLWRGGSRLPEGVRRYVALGPGERVLASAELVGGAVALATSHRLLVVGERLEPPGGVGSPDGGSVPLPDPTPWVGDAGAPEPPVAPSAPAPAAEPAPPAEPALAAEPAPAVTADRWVDIAGASLEAADGVLEVELVAGPRRVLLLGRGRGRRFATATRERIQHSVLLTRTVELGRRRVIRVVARREPGGEAFLQIVPGPGVSVTGPDVAAAVAEAERAVREQVGLPPAP